MVQFEKDIYVRDGFGVRRRAFVAGQEVEGYVLEAVLRTSKVVNPEDLPDYKGVKERILSLYALKEEPEPAEAIENNSGTASEDVKAPIKKRKSKGKK